MDLNVIPKVKILVDKKKYKISRFNKNMYKVDSFIENKNIYVEKVFTFDLIKLTYQMNRSLFDRVETLVVDENNQLLFVLMKPMLQNLGVLQRYFSIKLTKTIGEDNSVCFTGIPYHEYAKSLGVPNAAIHSPITKLTFICNKLSPHSFHLIYIIELEDAFYMHSLFEKIFISLLKDCTKNTIHAVEQIF